MDGRARVLIVEDEAIIAMHLEQMVSRLGHQVVGVVSRSRDVVPAVQRLRPDVVMMDVRLDGPKDGAELAAELHAIEPIAVVFVTAFSEVPIVERMARSAAFASVTKPVDEERLAAALGDVRTRLRELSAASRAPLPHE